MVGKKYRPINVHRLMRNYDECLATLEEMHKYLSELSPKGLANFKMVLEMGPAVIANLPSGQFKDMLSLCYEFTQREKKPHG